MIFLLNRIKLITLFCSKWHGFNIGKLIKFSVLQPIDYQHLKKMLSTFGENFRNILSFLGRGVPKGADARTRTSAQRASVRANR